MSDQITSIEQLDALYGAPVPTSILKELDHITDDYATLINVSPFVVIATSGPEGLDCSPRGDPTEHVPLDAVPTVGQMMQNLSGDFDGKAYDADHPERMKRTIY